MNTILVVGSINMDLVARCPHVPAPGETVLGSDFAQHPGGPGANTATAAARLARDSGVAMLGAVGSDDNGVALTHNLRERGVDTASVATVAAPTGVALIAVADDGANSIVVAPGANSQVLPPDIDAAWAALTTAPPAILVTQMEIPLETVVRAALAGRDMGARVLLDPAPAPAHLPDSLLAAVDILMPNEGELRTLTGLPTGTVEEVARAAEALRARGVGSVVVKRGEHGALIVDEAGGRVVPAPRVEAIDTTGAGDCFNGALAAALAEGQTVDAAARFATHAAALACTALGAQEAQPTREQVDRLLSASH